MDEIRSLLRGSNGLQKVAQLSGSDINGEVASAEIRSRLKHLNQNVDKKVEDLYRSILGNFSKTVLPTSTSTAKELQPVRICVESKAEDSGAACRQLIPLCKKRQLEKATPRLLDCKQQQNKENLPAQTPTLVASKTKLHPPDERRAFVEIRVERTPKQPVCLPNIRRTTYQLSSEQKSIRASLPERQIASSADTYLILNERALLDKFDLVTFKVLDHQLDNSSLQFIEFQRAHHQNWTAVLAAIEAIQKFSRKHHFPDSKVDSKRLVELLKKTPPYRKEDILSCFSDVDEVLAASPSRELRYEGKVGRLRAIVRIQAWFRMLKHKLHFGRYQKLICNIKKIQSRWRCYRRLRQTRSLIQANSNRIIQRFQERQIAFRRAWPKIKQEARVEIHINSSFVNELKRLTSEKFPQRENCQITRVFRLRDPFLTIVYVSPIPLTEELISYYMKVLEISQVTDARTRLILVWPQNRFSESGCVCQHLLYSPKCIKRIRSIIKGKQAYLVPGYPSNNYMKIADLLSIPVYGTLPGKCRYFSSKSGMRSLTERNLPCEFDMFTVDQVLRSLADLIVRYPKVERWFFKIDDERQARGTAYLDLNWLRKFHSVLSSEAEQKELLVQLLAKHLPLKLRFVHRHLFKSYEEYMAAFISGGGVIEASPAQPESRIRTSSFLLDIEPEGTSTMLGSYDRINWQLKPVSCQYPAEFVVPQEELSAIGKKLYQRGITGYVSLDYLNCSEQEYWLVGVDCYLNDFSAVFFTAQAIGCYKSQLSNNAPAGEAANRKPDELRFLYCPIINHSGLAELQMRTFFHLCRLANISFDISRRIGSVFVLMDTLQSSTLGLLSFCDNNYGLYRYMANAFEFLGSRLDSTRSNGLDDPRTDYVSFEELKNRFRTLLKRLDRNKQRIYSGRLELVE